MATFTIELTIPDNNVPGVLVALDEMHPREDGLAHDAQSAKAWIKSATMQSVRRMYRRWKVRQARATDDLGQS